MRDIATDALTPYLAIRVNGVPIAARGGSWGMDDSRKRVSREQLEPYFRLHRAANLNIIRNWLGQNTEDVFYDLADEYGLLILNDFWESTQDFQVEPQDPQLFLDNARDVIRRYRNHPSIAVWFGRNEGVPQPIINEGLAAWSRAGRHPLLHRQLETSICRAADPTTTGRPSSISPTWRAASRSRWARRRCRRSSRCAPRFRRPTAGRSSDTYAYHDWHFGGNGDIARFMEALRRIWRGDEPRGLRAQGAADGLRVLPRDIRRLPGAPVDPNSGRLLWMTHPAWPSNTWQIYSSDYDTAAAYYAVEKACEPVHAQLNLPDFTRRGARTLRVPRSRL